MGNKFVYFSPSKQSTKTQSTDTQSSLKRFCVFRRFVVWSNKAIAFWVLYFCEKCLFFSFCCWLRFVDCRAVLAPCCARRAVPCAMPRWAASCIVLKLLFSHAFLEQALSETTLTTFISCSPPQSRVFSLGSEKLVANYHWQNRRGMNNNAHGKKNKTRGAFLLFGQHLGDLARKAAPFNKTCVFLCWMRLCWLQTAWPDWR